MRKYTAFLLSAMGIGLGAVLVSRTVRRKPRKSVAQPTISEREFRATQAQARQLAQPVLDLNQADAEALKRLGVDDQLVDRIIDNRPYRNKLDLVSRMVLPEAVYATIRDKVGVAAGNDPIKVA